MQETDKGNFKGAQVGNGTPLPTYRPRAHEIEGIPLDLTGGLENPAQRQGSYQPPIW